MDTSPGEEHEAFKQWVIPKGVKINGIAPARFPGRGMGMIATRVIEENETMLTVPLKAMLTVDHIPEKFKSRFPEGTPRHGILAAFLTLGEPETLGELDAWRAVWPQWQDFEDSLPLLWPSHLSASASEFQDEPAKYSALLPPSASGLWHSFEKAPLPGVEYETLYQNLLPRQEKRLMSAWNKVVSAFPDTDWETFVYHWLIVNSRSFYYVSPGGEMGDWNDALALVPFADYFNHDDAAACDVRYYKKKYTFTATRRYEKGEEIYMSYGPHSNDFLLIEYGFSLNNNISDSIYLDDIIFRDMTLPERKALISQPPFGNYEVTIAGPSECVKTAACVKYMTRKDWRSYVDGETIAYDPKKTANIINRWIEIYLTEANATLGKIQTMLNDSPSSDQSAKGAEWEKARLHTLLHRWEQIRLLCETVLTALGTSNGVV